MVEYLGEIKTEIPDHVLLEVIKNASDYQCNTAHEATVNCGHCTACCRDAPLIVLTEGERPEPFDKMVRIVVECDDGKEKSFWLLPHQPNGDCYYLRDGQCSVYEQRPKMCRTFDCRFIALKPNDFDMSDEVVKAGNKRLAEMNNNRLNYENF
jgi:Fe-S-cluster containining protein